MLVSLLASAAYGHHFHEIRCQNSHWDSFLSPLALEVGLSIILEKELMQKVVIFLNYFGEGTNAENSYSPHRY